MYLNSKNVSRVILAIIGRLASICLVVLSVTLRCCSHTSIITALDVYSIFLECKHALDHVHDTIGLIPEQIKLVANNIDT